MSAAPRSPRRVPSLRQCCARRLRARTPRARARTWSAYPCFRSGRPGNTDRATPGIARASKQHGRCVIVPETLSDLLQTVRQQVTAGRWATPDTRENSTTRLAPATLFEPHRRPHLLVRLLVAMEHAQAESPKKGTTAASAREHMTPATTSVLEALPAAMRRPSRPPQPWMSSRARQQR